MVDMQLIIYSAIGAAILAAIALIGSHMSTIVSIVSRLRGRMVEEGRARHAYRQRVYDVATVSDSQIGASVMSRETTQTTQTDNADRQTDRVSEADRWLDRLEVDRTKTVLIELLVYSGWDVSQVRSALKGDNGALGTEIEAARQRLGIAPAAQPAQYVTPIVGRPTSARFETDPEFPYQAPA